MLGKRWARARGVALKDVALEWEEPLLLAKSTKGYFEGTDWADAKERCAVLVALVGKLRVVEEDLEPAQSKVCSGYKIHAFGDAVSGLILSLSVTPGGDHYSIWLLPLLLRAKALHEHIQELLADAAYGGMRTRTEVMQRASR